ncbi:hypothetical protein Y032_0002g1135 [Ancylostoma ceylanicum]|uniref:Uncharacterized protein n=1 Tax=Ancylostoma ceylanicum TaxID=53326 RepID=A0A016VZU9_9BILA|nr:hypothetical protein Y032_0002g1135 [Ancylostoma ceylanicum]
MGFSSTRLIVSNGLLPFKVIHINLFIVQSHFYHIPLLKFLLTVSPHCSDPSQVLMLLVWGLQRCTLIRIAKGFSTLHFHYRECQC